MKKKTQKSKPQTDADNPEFTSIEILFANRGKAPRIIASNLPSATPAQLELLKLKLNTQPERGTIPLYHHKTDGGAQYLTDKFIAWEHNGKKGKEGIFEGATYIVRIDGDITKDAELTIAGNTAPAPAAKRPAFLSMHRVGYISLHAVEQEHGEAKREMLADRLTYAATEGCAGQCSLETLDDYLDMNIESKEISKADAKWMKQFIADCVAAGATGDLIWSN